MKIAILLVGVLTITLFSPRVATATIWYVHPDSNLNSIQAGLDSCHPGNDAGIQVIDYKAHAGSNHYWRMYRGNPERTGYYGDLVGVDEGLSQAESRTFLYQNYPNPFDHTTVISYQLSNTTWVDLSIYNLMGQKIKTLTEGIRKPGLYHENWSRRDAHGKRVSSGIYFYRLQTRKSSQTKKMVLLDDL